MLPSLRWPYSLSAPALLALLALLALPTPARAQDVHDAETLPAGVGGLFFGPAVSWGQDRYGADFVFFDRESALTNYNNIDIQTALAGDAADLGLLLGTDEVPDPANPGMTITVPRSLGYTQFDATAVAYGVNFNLAYGVTDRLTIGASLPFAYATFALDAHIRATKVDVDGNDVPGSKVSLTTLRIINPRALTCPTGEVQLSNLGELLEDGGPRYRFSVGDLRRLLTSDCLAIADPIDEVYDAPDGYAHGRSSRVYSGFKDMTLGAKYQFFHGRDLHLAGSFFVLLPIGRVDDPNDLFDPAFGDGHVAVSAFLSSTLPLGDFSVGLAAGYELHFADELDTRLAGVAFSDELETKLAKGELSEQQLYDDHLDEGFYLPITTGYDRVRAQRNTGDNIYAYGSVSYAINEWLGVSFGVDFGYHTRDELTDTGVRLADGKRLKTSAELRQDAAAFVQAEIDNGTIPEAQRDERTLLYLRYLLPSSAERKAAAFAWRGLKAQLSATFAVSVNTAAMFVAGEFPIPLIMAIAGTFPFAGMNVQTTDGISLLLTVPFVIGEYKDPAEYGYDDDPEPGRGLPWP